MSWKHGVIASLVLGLVSPLAQADVTWGGGAGSQLDPNWIDSTDGTGDLFLTDIARVGGPRLSNMGDGAMESFIIDGAGSHVTFRREGTGDFRPRQGVNMIVSNGATWEQVTEASDTENGWLEMDASSLTVDGGSFIRSGRALSHPDRPDDGGGAFIFGSWRSDDRIATYGDPVINVSLDNGGLIDNDGQLWFGSYTDHHETLAVNMTIDGNSSVNLHGGEITLDNSGIAVAGDLIFTYKTPASRTEAYTINFAGEGSITVAASGIKTVDRGESEFFVEDITYEGLWDEGILQWQGGNDGAFSDHFNVEGSLGSDGYRLTTKNFVGPGPSADLNGDGRVDAGDAGIAFGVWGTDGGDTGADLNGDNVVDAADAQIMFSAWTGDAPTANAGDATAAYNYVSGLVEISANGVVNVFVESAGGKLSPGNSDAAPAGLLASDNASRVGLTGFGGINVTNWKSQNAADIEQGDLTLVVGPALGVPAVTHQAGSANFAYIPEPATAGLLGLGLLGMLATRRR